MDDAPAGISWHSLEAEVIRLAEFDTVIRGGHVIDAAQNFSGQADVAIKGGRIAAVEPGIATDRAGAVIDATGQYVTPGLIDLHTHVYWGVTYWGIEPDPVAARSGVTTWLDVGSAGGYTFPGFRRWIAEPAKSRIFALLNMSSIGLVAPTWELSNIDYCDIDLGQMIVETLDGLAASNSGDNTAVEQAMRERVRELCHRFPIYPTL